MLYISISLSLYIYVLYVHICVHMWMSAWHNERVWDPSCHTLPLHEKVYHVGVWLHVPLMHIYIPYIYIYIYIHICLLYISDHSHTQVCIEGGSCPDGCETQPYYRMDVWQYLHWWTLLWLYALSHCKKNHVSHCCNCMTICRLRSFIEALIQLTTHSDITQSHIS